MIKAVMIRIQSIQNYEFTDEETLDFSTDGYYLKDGSRAGLSYMESAVTGLEGTRTSISVLPDRVTVDRDGLITSHMVFQEGEKSLFQYNTPYGAATLGIDTKKITQSFGEDGGELELLYVLNMEHAIVSRNKFHITVKQMGEKKNG